MPGQSKPFSRWGRIVTRNDDPSRKNFQCDQCDKRFVEKLALRMHKRQIHEPEKCLTGIEIKAIHCYVESSPKAANSQSQEDEQRPFVCPCGKDFKTSDYARRHLVQLMSETSVEDHRKMAANIVAGRPPNHTIAAKERRKKKLAVRAAAMNTQLIDNKEAYDDTGFKPHYHFQNYGLINAEYDFALFKQLTQGVEEAVAWGRP